MPPFRLTTPFYFKLQKRENHRLSHPTMSSHDSQPSFEYLALMPSSCIHSMQSEDCHSENFDGHDCSTESCRDVHPSNQSGVQGKARRRQLRKLQEMEEITRPHSLIKFEIPKARASRNRKFQTKQSPISRGTYIRNSLISYPQELPCVYGCMLDVFPWLISIVWILSILLDQI
jgi:hypothetical protein